MHEVIFTIGHSNHPIEKFLAMLNAHGVTDIIDVRKLPGSKYNPQYNNDALAGSLKDQEINYYHFPALGGRRSSKLESPNMGLRNTSFRAYADYMMTGDFEKALTQVLDITDGRRPALMCAEAVPWRCHRSLIADTLVARGYKVTDIFTEKKIEPHVLKEWVHAENGRVTYPVQSGDQLAML